MVWPSVFGIATRQGLDGTGIGQGRDFPHLSRQVLRPTQCPKQRVPYSSRRESGRGLAL